MPRVEQVKAWRTGLALPHIGLEPSGRSFVMLTIESEAGELLYPLSIEQARTLADELEALCRDAEAQSN
jgi:hypothetical protein